jgi:hypothetical protein
MKRFFFLNFLRKALEIGFKIWNKLPIKMYTIMGEARNYLL